MSLPHVGMRRSIEAAYLATKPPKAVVDCGFLVLFAAAVFSGGWLFVPAGIAYLVRDLRDPLGGDEEARVPCLESVTGVVGAIAGWIALAVITSDRLSASSRVTILQGPDGPTVVSGTLADLTAAGMPTDRPTTVIAITGLILGLMLIAAVAHDRTRERRSHALLGATVVAIAAISVVGSMSIGLYLLPALACGTLAWLIGWRRRQRPISGRPAGAATPAR